MSTTATQLPTRRGDLVIGPIGHGGRYVVKDAGRRDYFEIGQEEHFLLAQLDGRRTAEQICKAFEEQFGEALPLEDLDGFLGMARKQGLLENDDCGLRTAELKEEGSPSSTPHITFHTPHSKQSLLYWRKNFFDPDGLFTWLEPKIRFFWTRAFLALSAGSIVLATAVLWANRHEIAGSFTAALRWETALWVWLTLLLVTTLHEFAHGLTCKHYGGEVREIGFLLMYFMPCFYCNVSDAWLFREKSKRLWVTFAGGYFELFVWALAVFVWRLAVPESLVNYLAFVVLASCGIQSFFNFNPLLKLDGYYLVSDLVEIPNLRQRALERLKGWLRWLLWGAAQPARQRRGGFLLGFGIASWLYSLVFLGLMLVAMSRFLGDRFGALGLGAVALLGVTSTRGLLQGIASGEVKMMLLKRHKRSLGWLAALGALAGLLFGVEIWDWAGGPLQIRSAVRLELRAPVAAFLEEVYYEQGDWVSPGAPVVRLSIPDLESRLAQQRAELREAEAKLRLLQIGPRPEEVAAQQQRVARAEGWRDLALQDLARTQQARGEELARLDQMIAQGTAELEAAQDAYQREQKLLARRANTEQAYQEAQRRYRVCLAQLEQARAEKAARQATGTLEAEAELARRQKDLAAEQAALTLLEAGSRPEEIQAQRAVHGRLQEELDYLQQLQEKLLVYSPVPGVVTTPRLREKLRQYLAEGDLICVIEQPHSLQAEIALSEQDAARVQPGQAVHLKVRALPFQTLTAQVDRIAPVAAPTTTSPAPAVPQNAPPSLAVYCRVDDSVSWEGLGRDQGARSHPRSTSRRHEAGGWPQAAQLGVSQRAGTALRGGMSLHPEMSLRPHTTLRPGMTGHARIYTRRAPVGAILLHRVLRFLRTEFWW